MAETIYASFADAAAAERAAGALLDYGVRSEDVTLVASEHYSGLKFASGVGAYVTDADLDEMNEDEESVDTVYQSEIAAKQGISTTTPADAGAGAARGAGIGLGLGVLAGAAALLIPGVGFVVGGGALASALGVAAATTAAGALAGGVTGYLKDQGVPEEVVRDYGGTIEQGGAFLALRVPSGDVDRSVADEILAKYGGSNVRAY